MAQTGPLPGGSPLDLDYFVEWRPYLWRRPVADALSFLGDLRGKRLLEIGGRSGRMACLFALLGANVTMLEGASLDIASDQLAKHDVADRVRLIGTRGGFEEIAGETFDAIFTKSVLWCIEQLGEFLDELEVHLAPNGKVAFVENNRGARCLRWLRRHVVRRGRFAYEHRYFGIRPDQLPLFLERFDEVRIKRRLWAVYTILGRKKAPAA